MNPTNQTVVSIQNAIASYNMDCWVMFMDEGSDPYFKKYITDKVISTSLCIITAQDCYLIANNLDFDNLDNYKNVKNIQYGSTYGNKLEDALKQVFSEISFPSNISLSYSTLRDTLVDVLGHGSYEYLTKQISLIYEKEGKTVTFDSAEKLVYAITDRKSADAITKMKLAAQRANEILDQAFANIKTGMTEKEIVNMVQGIFDKKPEYFKEHEIIKEEYSWHKEFCPVVLAGPSLMKGGHATASNLPVEPGLTIYFDFGVKLHFKDGSYYSSDIQRMGYMLKAEETAAPKEVQAIFDTLYDAISLGIENLIPGKKGYEIDTVVRGYIKDAGYIDYDHSTGHAIGEIAHNPGTLLGPSNRGLSSLDIQPNGVYTIEPRIPIDNGGSIEEMVLATPEGGIAISPRQTSLYLI